MDENHFKDALLRSAASLSAAAASSRPGVVENNTRQGDMADQTRAATTGAHSAKLKATDAKILQAIEEALWRIEKGSAGCARPRRADYRRAVERDPWT